MIRKLEVNEVVIDSGFKTFNEAIISLGMMVMDKIENIQYSSEFTIGKLDDDFEKLDVTINKDVIDDDDVDCIFDLATEYLLTYPKFFMIDIRYNKMMECNDIIITNKFFFITVGNVNGIRNIKSKVFVDDKYSIMDKLMKWTVKGEEVMVDGYRMIGMVGDKIFIDEIVVM